ncbi:MAG TPA: acyl-CoA dehydrogenase family protein [Chitinophagales bacterium]|jgi:acyl-CoA dehydrogenase|nr:acyl-CoA dehydrogenase family protein [Chitinophagales bacterium]MBP6153359.1 acyl-CoA dehydrogenase family protein [Chitinophagales bacterium]HQV77436.1 acyl-CoA dehydrogenase family protein [Chitinophagales bacterium]HQW78498.1 acyl-CoA dehydrogenase family protein [Chitinophagales bacterium]HRB18876.1 acyl-CoA dehydrogenase family protein [Chitinophagales bacterium]
MSTALSYYFTEEHEMFRKSIQDFLKAEAVPHIDQWELDGKIPREFWKKFGEMGYFGLSFPEQYGGSNLDFFYTVVMLEEVSKVFSGGFAITAAVQVCMSSPYILHHGSEYLKETFFKAAIAGEKIGSIGITEPGAGSDVANIQTRAIKEGDYYVVNGSKTFITNGVYGHFVILVCKTNTSAGAAGVSLLVVDLNSEGISKTKLKKLGWHASDTAELHFDNVKVPTKNLLGEEGKGFYYLMGGLQLERLAGSIMGYSACEGMIQYGLEYMSQRHAFGRPINKFQVLRHKVAQLAAETEAIKFYVLQTCRMHNEGKYAVKESSISKLLASELADKCAYQILQVFGGYGYMEDFKIARAFRDSRIGTIGGGTSEIMREILAKMIIDDTNYDRATSINKEEHTSLDSVEAVFQTLPSRFKTEKAKGKNLNMEFKFDSATYFVSINDGILEIINNGNSGQIAVDCTVETDDATYVAVETGKLNPQEAFMSGKIKVSDLMKMMEFGGLFKKL